MSPPNSRPGAVPLGGLAGHRLLPRTLRGRLALTYVVLIAAVILSLGAYLAFAVRGRYVDQLSDQLEAQARLVGGAVVPAVATGEIAETDRLVKQLGSQIDARITVIGPDGTVLGDTAADPRTMENHGRRPEVLDALDRGRGRSERSSATVDAEFIYVAVPIPEVPGSVARVAFPLDEVDSTVRRLQRDVVLAAVIAASLTAAVAIFVAQRITGPLDDLRQRALAVTSGRLDVAVTPAATRELGDLGRAFNVMVARVRELVEESLRAGRRLEAIFANLSDGVVIVDHEGTVLGINVAATRVLGVSETRAVGQPVLVATRDHDLANLVEAALETNAVRRGTIDYGRSGRTLEATAQAVEAVGERLAILVVRDVTNVRRLESVRREFVANVSHELRTPLTSIRALVETLEAGAMDDPEVASDFLGRIVGEVDRLAALVDELLDLARLESGRVTLRPERLDPADLIRRGVERLRPQIERARLAVEVDVAEGLPPVLADRARIEQVLLNLVHNAIKFTPAGGKITVAARVEGDRLAVSVADTGVGIAEAELPRVFERFYKADRARRSDGTGLGLAIAKHIVQAHRGAISVMSRAGEGATFVFTLPLAPADPAALPRVVPDPGFTAPN